LLVNNREEAKCQALMHELHDARLPRLHRLTLYGHEQAAEAFTDAHLIVLLASKPALAHYERYHLLTHNAPLYRYVCHAFYSSFTFALPDFVYFSAV
jgi:malate/lactate dehydrogenase